MAYEYEDEEWKDVSGYEGFYKVSNLGNIKSVDRKIERSTSVMELKGKAMSQYIGNTGYPMVSLCINGESKRYSVHRIYVDNNTNEWYT